MQLLYSLSVHVSVGRIKVTDYLSDKRQRFHACPVRVAPVDIYHFFVRLPRSLLTGITTHVGKLTFVSIYFRFMLISLPV